MPAAVTNLRRERAVEERLRLRTSAYDQASSALVALLVLLGASVACVVLIYFARTLVINQVAIAVHAVEMDNAGRSPEAAPGFQRDLEPPGIEETPELMEPQLQETLAAVVSATSQKSALISSDSVDSQAEVGRGAGAGDSREVGDGREGASSREPAREMRFEPKNLAEYAELLDFFGMELAVLGRDNKVHYASGLSQATPSIRTGEPKEDRRLYFNSAGGPLAGLDRQLADLAGIADEGSYILVYLSAATEQVLLDLELKAAGGRPVAKIMRTAFRAKRAAQGFAFSVEEQDFYP
jgi:hypothetical protein